MSHVPGAGRGACGSLYTFGFFSALMETSVSQCFIQLPVRRRGPVGVAFISE